LDQPAADESPVPQPGPAGVFENSNSNVEVLPNGRITTITDPGRTIRIEETPRSIYMKVVGEIDGKPATREYRARSAEQLRREPPAAYALYRDRAGDDGMRGPAFNVQIAPAAAVAAANRLERVRLTMLE